MDTLSYNYGPDSDNDRRPTDLDKVNEVSKRCLSEGQSALLDRIRVTGDVVDLDEAVTIVSRFDTHAYGQIVVLMNLGIVAADFLDGPWIDPEIVLRRI